MFHILQFILLSNLINLLNIFSPHYFNPGDAEVKNPPAKAEVARDTGSIPGSGRSSGEGNGNPLQYPCLENSMVRGAWQARVHGVAKKRTQLSAQRRMRIHTHTHTHTHMRARRSF